MANSTPLSTFFERSFLPLRIGREGAYASQCRTAIRWLADHLGRPATLGDLTSETLDALRDHMEAEGIGTAQQGTVRKRLFALQRTAVRLGRYDDPAADQVRPLHRRKQRQPRRLEASPGTIAEFFETVYRPLRLVSAAPVTLSAYRSCFRVLRKWHGGDVPLSEHNDSLAADFFEWLLECRTAVTVNKYRAHWFSVWRLAHEHGKATEPKVRRFPEQIDEPDAWTEDEMRAIVAATSALAGWPAIAGHIPADRYFRALFLVAWWGALRRGSLFKLKPSDVDLATGWLTVPGGSMKNRKGQRYRLGDDALEAVQAIWDPARELLFPWPHNYRRLYEYFDEVLRVASVAPSSRRSMTKLHKIRRTVATCAAMQRGMAAATALLNQSGPEVTRRYIDASKLPGSDATEFLPIVGTALNRNSELDEAGRSLAEGDHSAAGWRARIALERRIEHLCALNRIEFKPARGLQAHLDRLRSQGAIDSRLHGQLRQALHDCHQAAHGHDIGAERAANALRAVGAFLEEGGEA